MKDSIFREYDIRGVVGVDFLLEETLPLCTSIISFLQDKHPQEHTIIVGHDARAHSLPILENFISAAQNAGLQVINIGLAPSPLVYYTRHVYKTPLACVITASHNPKEYNGIKIWGVYGQQIQEIRQRINAPIRNLTHKKMPVLHQNMNDHYIDFMRSHFTHLKHKNINAVIDCGNGAAGPLITQLVHEMDWRNAHILYAEPDGTFPHHEADPTVPENMQDVKKFLEQHEDVTIGIGFDGDADRMNPMTKKGELVAGDKMLALYAQQMLKEYPGAAVVFDIKSSSSLIELLTKWGARPCIAPSGHSLIKQEMIKQNARLAGELSCHFFFNDRYFGYDDGIYAAIRLIELIDAEQKGLDELLHIIPRKEISPEIRIACDNDIQKKVVVEEVKKIFAAKKEFDLLTIDGIRASTSYGWGLLRASNTQPVICLRFESTTKDGFERIKQDFYSALSPYITLNSENFK